MKYFKIEFIFFQLYRHGDRSPIESFPTDPNRNASIWPDGYGQLTKVGLSEGHLHEVHSVLTKVCYYLFIFCCGKMIKFHFSHTFVI